MTGNATDEIIEKLFESLLQKYQKELEESMKGREFDSDTVDLLHYKRYKMSLNCGRSYIDSPKWLNNKKARLNPKDSDDKCFQYTIIVALNHEQIKSHLEKKIMSFINKYNWKEINFASHKNDCLKQFETNNKTIALSIICTIQ